MVNLNVGPGLEVKPSHTNSLFFEGCVLGKHHRMPFPKSGRERGSRVGELVHADIVGPMRTLNPGGCKYFVCFKDDFSGYRTINFMKQKTQVLDFLKFLPPESKHQPANQSIRSDLTTEGSFSTLLLSVIYKKKVSDTKPVSPEPQPKME